MLGKQGKPRGVVELSYKVFNFTEDQDLKLKIGYNAFKQVSALKCDSFYILQFWHTNYVSSSFLVSDLDSVLLLRV